MRINFIFLFKDYVMEQIEYLENEIDKREQEIFDLNKEIEAMNDYFDKCSEPLVKKAVLHVANTLRRFPREALQFDDDSKLNFFEEVCVMIQEGSIDDYFLVRSTLESCCVDACEIFNKEENFVLNHRTEAQIKEVGEIIEVAFFEYAGIYENKKITEAFSNRN